jgi:hypothetical protein
MKDLRRCYNTKSCLEKLAAEASARARLSRKTAAKPTAAKDDAAKIIGVAEANGCVEFGRAWVQRFGGGFAEFRKALAWKLDHDQWVASLR